MNRNTRISADVMTGLFAGVIFLGIQAFRIPLPAAVGTPFLHFGHIFVMLAIVCLSPVRATISGVVGLIIFDILNGYIHAIPNVFISTVIKCMLVGCIYQMLKKKVEGDKKKMYRAGVLCAGIYGVTNIVLDFVISVIELLIAGSGFQAAIAAEITSIPATIINACFTIIGIAVLYVPITTAYRRVVKER